MTLSNDDIDYIESELKQTTVGYVNKKWSIPPAGTHWANALARLESGRDVPVPVPPPPPPVPSTGTYETAIKGTLSNDIPKLTKNVAVSSQSELNSAISNMQAGQHIYASSPFSYSGEFVVNKLLSGRGEVSLDGVTFTGTASGSRLPNIYIKNIKNIYIYFNGAETKGSDHQGILVQGGDTFGLYDFNSHDNGGDGLDMFPVIPIQNYEVRGYIAHCGLKVADDPHSEKGTGLHACNLADGVANLGAGKIQLDIYNQPTGAGIEIGQPTSSLSTSDVQIWTRIKKLGSPVSGTTWTTGYSSSRWGSGNAIQFWGAGAFNNVRVEYLEADACMGIASLGGLTGSLTASVRDITVVYGIASNMSLSPVTPDTPLWDTTRGIKYITVSP